MTPRDFCYWLQGSFELGDATSPHFWSPDFRELVKIHLDLVNATEGSYDPNLVRFIAWMEGAMDSDVHCNVVRDKLNSIFEHVIDPTTSQSNPGAMNQIHHGDDAGYRC